jgi:hypothetical protein
VNRTPTRLSSTVARLDASFLAPVPALRLATLRVLVGAFTTAYLLARVDVMVDFRRFAPSHFQPVGMCSLLGAPLPQAWVIVIYVLALGLSLAFALGERFRIVGPLCALAFTWVSSYRNSWGMIFHTDNLLLFHLWVVGLSRADCALVRRTVRDAARELASGWPVRLLCALTVASYLLAGVAKLKASGPAWMEGEILRNYIAYDALRKAQVGSLHSPLGAFLVQYSAPFLPIGVLTMALELLGPLALARRKLARLWVLGVYGFHVGVLATMAIAFPYPLSGIAFASFFDCEKLWETKLLSRVRSFLER